VSHRRLSIAFASLAAVALTTGPIVLKDLSGHGSTTTTSQPENEQFIPTLAASTGMCGVERWPVKTGTDADTSLVNTATTTPAAVTTMRSYSAPSSLPSNNRIQPQETTVYSIDATLTEYKLETDSDYHLVIQDGAGNTMITEIPDPACAAGSLFLAGIQSARSQFDAAFSATPTFKTTSVPVRVRGIGFFDYLHGQTGVAPNGIELHPVLDIQFNPGATPPPPQPGSYFPLSLARILDTRDGTGGVQAAPLGPGGSLNVQVSGAGGVSSTASAAVINVTVTNTTAPGYLTVFPTGVARPLASNLNWTPGQTSPNLVEVPLGLAGQVTVYNSAGNADVIFDVAGYVDAPVGVTGLFNPVVPVRVLDTRDGTGAPPGRVGAGGTLNLSVTGLGGAPANGVSAVVLNVTAANPDTNGFLTVFPTGTSTPLASNLNFVAGQTVPNRVIVAVGSGGQVSIFNKFGTVDVIADLGGWFTDASNPSATGSKFVGVTPARIMDTRDGTGLVNGIGGIGATPTTQFGPGEGIAVQVAGHGGVPAMTDPNAPSAVVANVTVTAPNASGYLTAWPDGSPRPLASDLNWVAGQTVPNLVVVKLGSSGMADLYNALGCTDAVVDVVGYYTGPLPSPSSPLPATHSCAVNGNPWGYNFSCCQFIVSPPGNICSYFSCIGSFWNGSGYVVECVDSTFSKSGGISGACSSHGGPRRALYSP
jgi:hypothetical protein